MKKSVWMNIAIILRKLLRIGLFTYVILLFTLMSINVSSKASYAISKKSKTPIVTAPPVPTPTATTAVPTPTPTTAVPTPTPTTAVPTPTPTTAVPTPTAAPVPTQPAQVAPVPQTGPPSAPVLSPDLMLTIAASTPQNTKPTIKVVATPKTAIATVSALTTPHLQSADDKGGMNALTLSLILGVGAPLLMISGGGLWFFIKWQINRRRLAQQEAAQANPWMNSNGMQPSLHALQSASGASLNMIAPSTSAPAAFPMPASLIQSTYTPSDLRPVTRAFSQQLLTLQSNGVIDAPLNGDMWPLSIGSLDLSLEAARAIESNSNGHMPLLPAFPTALMDTPTSSMPSSPPISSGLPMLSQTSVINDDIGLESAKHQAQMGLFVLPGREQGLI
jgi:hypothetical protein